MPGSKHRRKAIRLQGYDYGQPGEYFVTIRTKDREHVFGEIDEGRMQLNGFGEIVVLCWMDLPNHYPCVHTDEFVVMPNHVHGIIVITEPVGQGSEPSPTKRYPLSEIVRRFKTFSPDESTKVAAHQVFPFGKGITTSTSSGMNGLLKESANTLSQIPRGVWKMRTTWSKKRPTNSLLGSNKKA
jgi:REP element-mobilizing transposase RayT